MSDRIYTTPRTAHRYEDGGWLGFFVIVVIVVALAGVAIWIWRSHA